MSLRVYNENFLAEKAPAIEELEKEIIDLKLDTKLTDAARSDAITNIKHDIAYLESKIGKKESGQKFLPLDSLRGRADLKSNVIEIIISPSSMTKEEIQKTEKIQEEKAKLTKPLEEKAEVPIMKLNLSCSKSTYTANEPLPLELSITDISRDLPVAKSTVYGKGMFSGLVVKDANGNLLKPEKPISSTPTIKKLYREGKFVNCIPGLKLCQGDRIFVHLDDLSKFYSLKPGKYSLQLVTKLKIYKDEFLIEKPQVVIEYEQEIESIKKDPKLSEGAKKDGIANLEKEIKFQMSEFGKKGQEKYLALDSVEEKREVKSNEIQIQVCRDKK